MFDISFAIAQLEIKLTKTAIHPFGYIYRAGKQKWNSNYTLFYYVIYDADSTVLWDELRQNNVNRRLLLQISADCEK
jgi:hypothetical protein